jgi:two-component system, LuxR family, sensor kinase FixL
MIVAVAAVMVEPILYSNMQLRAHGDFDALWRRACIHFARVELPNGILQRARSEDCTVRADLGAANAGDAASLHSGPAAEFSDAELSGTLTDAAICVWSLDLATERVICTETCAQLFGLPREHLNTLASFQALLHPDDRQARADAIEHVRHHGGPYEVDYRIVRPNDGEIRWLRSRGRVQVDEQGHPVAHRGVVFSIDGQKRAEAEQTRVATELRAREAHLQSILDTVPAGMIVADERGAIQAFSPAAERLFGYPASEAIGRNVRMLMPEPNRSAHDGYLEHYRATGERHVVGTSRVMTGQRRNGASFPMEIALGEMRTGDEVFFTAFITDLTEQQQTEAQLQSLQSELAHVSRLSAMAEMGSALAHELNQPLSAISSYTLGSIRLLERADPTVKPRIKEALGKAAEQALRAGQIIRRLREFIARGATVKRDEAVSRLIESAIALALIGAREQGIKSHVSLDPNAVSVMADRVQIQQVLFNLMRNARDAMQHSERRDLTISATPRAPGMVAIMVADTGPGIADELVDRVFQPFVTTKPNGMGVGLSICRSIVEAHGGQLTLERNGPDGATFCLTLPAAGRTDPDRPDLPRRD